jgi:hypothetical protein
MKPLSGPFVCRLLAILVSAAALLLLLHMRIVVLPKLPTPVSSVEHKRLCDQLHFDSRQILLVDGLYAETKALRAGVEALTDPLIVLTSLILALQLLPLKRTKQSKRQAKS